MSANNDRRSRWLANAFCAAILIGGVACATTQSASTEPELAVLTDVQVEQRGEMTVVTLEGVGHPLYAAMDDDGRLVLDLAAVRPEGVPEEIALVGGVLEEVDVAAMQDGDGAPFTRVELALDGPFEYDVVPHGDDLTIHVIPGAELAAEDDASGPEIAAVFDTAEAESVFTTPTPMASGAEETFEPEAPAQAEAPLAPPATAITGFEIDSDGTHIHLLANGRLDGTESFALENPARLVIDASGIESQVDQPRLDVAGPHVASVRIGQHPDKVRVVLDGAEGETFSHVSLTPLNDGLLVALAPVSAGPEGLDAEPMAAAPEARLDHEGVAVESLEAPMAAQESAEEASAISAEADALAAEMDTAPLVDPGDAATHVTRVDLLQGAGSDRVVIVTEGPGSYNMFEPDPQTVVVSLPDAAILPGADARIAPEPGGPVSLVMAFQQPDVETPEVRVVITRGPGERPLVTREGANVVVAFDSHGSAAVTPPAITAGTGAAADKGLAQATAPGLPASAAEGDALDILHEGGLLDGKQYVGRRISLDFKDVEIDDVLRLIAEVSDLNIIAGDDVSGQVTVRLVDVPWDQALDVILLTRALGFVKVGNVLRIAPRSMLQSEAEGRLQERRAKEKLEDLVVKFQPVNYAAVGNVAKMVQRLLSARGTVNTDSRTNTVIIKDIPSVIDESVALIKAIDTPTPQVLIEAKIVEANLDFSRELGTVWGFGVQQLNDGFDTGSGVNPNFGSTNFNPHPDPRILDGAGDLNNFSVDNPISSVPTALVNLGAFLLDEKYNLEVQLQAAESTGEGKVISSPRIVTLDNREAEIQQGVAIPYQTFENGDAQLQFIDAVLSLRVKPHITADRSIIMKLEVTRDAPDDSVATGSVGAPAIAKNQAKTETLVRDGQTLVIGGIYTVQKGTRMSRVPYLWQIPVIGYAFRNNSIRDIRKELLIFVTPRIVDMPQLGS
ncbi:MAG: type IV pilus secretin PilQ [Deltaproteobacteria bacterium]|nr:type IV pilus secretin PilQ [Deltaproteobacteria bacterium]